MQIHHLKPAPGSIHKRKRVGRGEGSKKGGTSGRGHKGNKSRSGFRYKFGFEGGQMPITRRLPKRGFKNPHRTEYNTLNLDQINHYVEKYQLDEITPEVLFRLRIFKRKNRPFKVLGRGELTKSVRIRAHAVTPKAMEKLQKANIQVELIPFHAKAN
jgi:large subunit ribosomal protein L15